MSCWRICYEKEEKLQKFSSLHGMSTQINYCGLDANNSSVAPVQRKEEKYSWAANRGG